MVQVVGLEPKRYIVTAEGMEELKQQLETFKEQRAEVTTELQEITSQSDEISAHEDSTLVANQDQATELDGQIDLLERVIGMAEVVQAPKTNDVVAVGSRVTLETDGREQHFRIVGPIEANPESGCISLESPFGESLLGKKVGDTVEIHTPAGGHMSTIKQID